MLNRHSLAAIIFVVDHNLSVTYYGDGRNQSENVAINEFVDLIEANYKCPSGYINVAKVTVYCDNEGFYYVSRDALSNICYQDLYENTYRNDKKVMNSQLAFFGIHAS